MAGALDRLFGESPTAVTSSARSGNQAQFRFTLELPDLPVETFDLVAAEDDSVVAVREQSPGTKLPAFCPQRHIQLNSALCLGLEAGKQVGTAAAAALWWRDLGEFLSLQCVAEALGYWPPGKELAHTVAAGRLQLRAEALAARLGLLPEFRKAMEAEDTWIKVFAPRPRPSAVAFFNGRASCPLGCVSGSKYPILRRQCMCPRKPGLVEFARKLRSSSGRSKFLRVAAARRASDASLRSLASMEFGRRFYEHEYWSRIVRAGYTCKCRVRMAGCRLPRP